MTKIHFFLYVRLLVRVCMLVVIGIHVHSSGRHFTVEIQSAFQHMLSVGSGVAHVGVGGVRPPLRVPLGKPLRGPLWVPLSPALTSQALVEQRSKL